MRSKSEVVQKSAQGLWSWIAWPVASLPCSEETAYISSKLPDK